MNEEKNADCTHIPNTCSLIDHVIRQDDFASLNESIFRDNLRIVARVFIEFIE